MRRAAVATAFFVLAVAVVAADAAPLAFDHGVAAGEVTSTSAVLWTRAPSAGRVTVEVTAAGSARVVARRNAFADPANDLTVQVRMTGLEPGKRYAYRFRQGSTPSQLGFFRTAPRPSADARVRFAFTGDADATHTENGKPAYSFDVYARMAAERNDFNVNVGDTIYSDSAVGGAEVAVTVEQKWAKYRLALDQLPLRWLRLQAGLYSHWDDHEFVNDFSRPEHGETLYRASVKAFRDYSPVRYSDGLGLYRSVRWGRNLELFFLDARSFRSAKVTGACREDLLPTAPQSTRNAVAALVPSLRNPVPPACTAAIGARSRTMLGARQLAAFTRAVSASPATWKVVVNEVPIQQYYLRPYDRWEGYAAERERLLRFLQANAKNVVFITTDTHANLVNRIRYRTLGGAPADTGMWEVVAGPAATGTFSAGLDRLVGRTGGAAALAALFLKPSPPNGIGMRCAALDVLSYAQVTVTSRRLTIASRDARGRPVREASGRVCPPLVLTAR
jgi:alkaline phosphatase D